MAWSKALIAMLIVVQQNAMPGHSFDMSIGDATEILKFSRELVTDVLESYHLIKPSKPGEEQGTDFPFVRKMEKRIMNQINAVSRQLEKVEFNNHKDNGMLLDQIIAKIPENQRLELTLTQLYSHLFRIENAYQNFVNYAKNPSRFERYTMEAFVKGVVGPGPSELPDCLKMIHRAVVPPSDGSSELFHKSLLTQMAKNMNEASTQICNTDQSPQQLLYNLYRTIAIAEIKAYAMMQFSYALLRLYNMGNFTEEMELLKQQYINRTSDTLKAVKTAMSFAPREVWKCDPKVHKEDETYTQLKQVFQGYIVNEVDLNSQTTCRENCGYYSYTKQYGCFKNNYCAQQRMCNGKVLNCQYIDSDMWICPSERGSSRRYEYIEYEDDQQFGQKNGKCKKPVTKVDSWWRWLFWHCSYCMCYCDDHNINSDRYFNLRDVTSDIENNKVVTGARLKKVNQIVHIQIQQGTLLPRGNIDEKSLEWKRINNYTILDADVQSGVDYHTVMWESRTVDLDDLEAPEGYLLTGLRFRLVGAHLNLEIQMTPFNFTKGELVKEKSQWHSNDNTEASEIYDTNGDATAVKKRTELKLNKPDIPTRSKVQNYPDSQSNQYLHFGPSDLERDAAQSTIPFIDIQGVTTNPPVPISGAGIYHKGRDGYGGFIALKIFTYNIEPQLSPEVPGIPSEGGLDNEINSV